MTETFYRCLLIVLLGIPILGGILYFLISLFLYADHIQDEREKKFLKQELDKEKQNDDRRKDFKDQKA